MKQQIPCFGCRVRHVLLNVQRLRFLEAEKSSGKLENHLSLLIAADIAILFEQRTGRQEQ